MMITLLVGDALSVLRTLPAESFHCCVTSPPYWGLRDYGVAGQLGREPTPEEYVARMVEVFAEVRRVLRRDGTLWLNLGDCWTGSPGNARGGNEAVGLNKGARPHRTSMPKQGLPAKSLLLMPHRVALALQQDGWVLRQEIIWHKRNPLPESVQDRPGRAHEQIFLLAKAGRYYYDHVAVREPATASAERAQHQPLGNTKREQANKRTGAAGTGMAQRRYAEDAARGRNLRSVWSLASHPYREAHFATFPPELARRCITAGTSERGCCTVCGAPWVREASRRFRPQEDVSKERGRRGAGAQKAMDQSNGWQGLPRGTTEVTTTGWQPSCACGAGTIPCRVLDPFGGAGTTGLVARRLGRAVTLIELSPKYAELARRRIAEDAPLLNGGTS